MGVKTRSLIVFLGAVALVAAVWFGRESGDLDVSGASANPEGPEISKTGPFPKAVVDEIEYNFGAMEVGTTKRHTFVIRNEGEAPLILEKGDTTCKCTLSELAKNEIAPGESVEVELEWTPESSNDNFSQQATIHTNDPKNNPIDLVIHGSVGSLLTQSPAGIWNMGVVSEHEPTVVSGTMYSSILDDFKIFGIESKNPLLTATFKELSKEALTDLKAKSGYSIEATLAPGVDVGAIEEILTIRMDARDVHERKLLLDGSRVGPIQVLLISGGRYSSTRMSLDLGRISAADGKKAKLLMFVSPPKEEPFKILDVQVINSSLTFDVTEDEEFESKTKQRFQIQVTMPPGKPPVARTGKKAIRIQLKTNHPKAQMFEFKVGFIST